MLAVSGDFSSCILLKFYIKPQRPTTSHFAVFSCILLKFYIKPQLDRDYGDEIDVVSY